MLNRINTNNIVQVQRSHKAISPNVSMCGASSKYVPYMLLNCSAAESLWNFLFDIVGESWIHPRTLD